MQEAKSLLPGGREFLPVATDFFEQVKGTHHVRLNESRRAGDRTVDVGFRGEIEDRLGAISLQNAGDQRPVANVSPNEDIAVVLGKSFEMGRVCSIGEEIQVYHARFGALPLGQDEVAADEARSTGHEMCFHRLPNPIA